MTGPGMQTVTAICPHCYQEVVCEVLVTVAGTAHTVSGPAEHNRNCREYTAASRERWREEIRNAKATMSKEEFRRWLYLRTNTIG